MPDQFQFDVFLSHSAKDKGVVRPLAERLRQDGLRVWFGEWVLKPGDSIPAKIEEGLEHSRVLVLCMSVNTFGSDWAQLEAGTFRFRDPLNKERRFIPLRLDEVPIKGSLAQFLYINWLPAEREQEYAKLVKACRHPAAWPVTPNAIPSKDEPPSKSIHADLSPEAIQFLRRVGIARRNEWERLRADFDAQARMYPDLKLSIIYLCKGEAAPSEAFKGPNHMINLWQYYGDDREGRERLAASELTTFGFIGADVGAYAVIDGQETELFRRMASRAGSLLPDDIDQVVLDNVRKHYDKPEAGGASTVVANRNPLAKWLNLVR
ncbi:MAG: toll/interleukin-1 receptor domain-containing protein [Limisphaerales bacterium]